MTTNKSKEIEVLMTSIAGISRQDAVKQNICTYCHMTLKPFLDALSKREHEISGLCQDCQDKTFGTDY